MTMTNRTSTIQDKFKTDFSCSRDEDTYQLCVFGPPLYYRENVSEDDGMTLCFVL